MYSEIDSTDSNSNSDDQFILKFISSESEEENPRQIKNLEEKFITPSKLHQSLLNRINKFSTLILNNPESILKFLCALYPLLTHYKSLTSEILFVLAENSVLLWYTIKIILERISLNGSKFKIYTTWSVSEYTSDSDEQEGLDNKYKNPKRFGRREIQCIYPVLAPALVREIKAKI